MDGINPDWFSVAQKLLELTHDHIKQLHDLGEIYDLDNFRLNNTIEYIQRIETISLNVKSRLIYFQKYMTVHRPSVEELHKLDKNYYYMLNNSELDNSYYRIIENKNLEGKTRQDTLPLYHNNNINRNIFEETLPSSHDINHDRKKIIRVK